MNIQHLSDHELLSDHRHIACYIRAVYEDNSYTYESQRMSTVFSQLIRLAQVIQNPDEKYNLIRGMTEILSLNK